MNSVTDFFADEIVTELLKQLLMISAKPWIHKNTAKQLFTLIESIQPTIIQIQYSGVELPAHRQAQIDMLFDALERGKKLTDKILSSGRWNVYRQRTLARQLEKLEMTISNFLRADILSHILADVYCLQADLSVRYERVDNSHERVIVGSMRIWGGGFIRDVMNLGKIRSQIGMIVGCLLLLFSCLQYFAYKITPLPVVVGIPKVLEYNPIERTEITLDKDGRAERTEITLDKDSRAKPSDAKTNADFLDRTLTNSIVDGKVKPPQIQVFINFRGVQLRNNFVGYLVHALRRNQVNVFIDNYEQRGEDLNTLFKRIGDSGIAIVVFSSRYTESKWCLEELVKIKERVQKGLLKVLPIFYKVSPTDVKRLKGEFGDHFRDKEYMYEYDQPKIKRWKEAILFVSHKFALTFDEKSGALEIDFVETIVKEVLEMLQSIPTVESSQSSR